MSSREQKWRHPESAEKPAAEEKFRHFPLPQTTGLPGTEEGHTRPVSGEFAVLPPWGKGLYRGYCPVPRRPEAGTKKTAAALNCTPFVRQYDILDNKWGALLWQKGYQTNATHQNSRRW